MIEWLSFYSGSTPAKEQFSMFYENCLLFFFVKGKTEFQKDESLDV